jgi:cytochrome c
MGMKTRVLMGAQLLAPLSVVLAVLSSNAVAASVPPEQLARDSGCLSCHSITEKVVGPAYQKVADKYKGQSDAVAELAQSVRNGSQGKWGRIPMPAHGSMPEEDIRTLVKWVLSQTPAKP